MKFNEIDLPSNRKFGFFLTFLFAVISAYFYYAENITWALTFFAVSFIFFIISLTKSDTLRPLNNLWMHFGLILGMVVSPVVLGIIFFGLFTPLALFMRLCGRDELRLKFTQKSSHWISRNQLIKPDSFKNQF